MVYRNLLAEQVAEYVAQVKPEADEEHRHFRDRSSLDEAIKYSVYAIKANGKRHSHQYRIKVLAMEAVRKRLMGRHQDLRACHNFEELHAIVSECAVSGFAALCIYDTTARLGAYFGKRPEHVYLHRGTTVGAAALGLGVSREYICLNELPKELRWMQVDDIENFLCIYKDELKMGEPASKSKCLPRRPKHPC